jgi:hypothetical protein
MDIETMLNDPQTTKMRQHTLAIMIDKVIFNQKTSNNNNDKFKFFT